MNTASLWLAAWLGCADSPPDPPDPPPQDTVSTATTADTSTPGTTGDTSNPTGDTGPPVLDLDCAAIPETPLELNQLEFARGYHDVAFDTVGHIIGSDNAALLKVTYGGKPSVFLPGSGTVQGMDWLPGGDLVYADGIGNLMRVTPAGAPSLLVGSSGASVYGVTVGPDGNVYSATWDTIERHDPITGEHVTILDNPAIRPYVLDFSPDHTKMYVGTIWAGGSVWVLDLDADLLPVGTPTLFATIGSGVDQLHDALAVDWCGNVYVAEFYTNNLYRISPAGDATLLVDYTYDSYGHGIEWGSGIGGWRTDAIYVPQPYNNNKVMEIVIGVPAREWTGSVWPP